MTKTDTNSNPTFREFLSSKRITDNARGSFVRKALGDEGIDEPCKWGQKLAYLIFSLQYTKAEIMEAKKLWKQYERMLRG